MKKNKKNLKVGEKAHLSDLRIGQKAIVLALHIEKPELRRHLLDMGITRGTEIKVKKIAPLRRSSRHRVKRL